ncbi:hypothetical protein [Sphingomonas sp.]|uniref:hypothetical protein n=1 Tax=Sphingomonas sp. TaxID=28214 RepID=UPI002DD63870|nr:hypothetical protein [Sphingomonas sp.]
MITRTAIFEGRIHRGHEDAFFTAVKERLAPLWRAFPGAVDVRFYAVDECDDPERPVFMIQQIDYPSIAAMEHAITSPERDAARAVTMELMTLVDGRLYHVITGRHHLIPGP